MGMTIPIPGSSHFECSFSYRFVFLYSTKLKLKFCFYHLESIGYFFSQNPNVCMCTSLQIYSFYRDSIKVGVSEPGKTYVWREQGYTSCSASCLGGVEELIVNCIREDTGKVVSPFLCSPETKPEARIRTCNDRPCPPRWNYSDYSPCSKSCGIGIREREVQCIHEVTRGGENTMVVPNNMCPQPPPLERQYCNVLDCPVRWEVSEWSKCSK